MNRMSIRYKLLFSFLSLVLLLLPILIYNIISLNNIKQTFSVLVDQSFPSIQALLEMKNISTKTHEIVSNFNVNNTKSYTQMVDQKNILLAYLGDIYTKQKELSNYHQNTLIDIQKLNQLRDAFILATLNAFSEETKQGPDQLKTPNNVLDKAQGDLDSFIKKAVSSGTNLLKNAKIQALKTANKLYVILEIAIVVFILLAIIVSLFLADIISMPIIRLTRFAKNIDTNSLDQKAPILSHDEIGDLTLSFNVMLENLQQAKSELIKASHHSGAAEVATNILHNVGNVLNSINVSTALIKESLTKSQQIELQKIITLFNAHAEDLGDYLKNDKQGKLLIPYFQKLTEYIEIERKKLLEEIIRVTKDLEHVTQIVAMQQSVGKSNGVMEKFSVSELINESFSICLNKADKDKITLEWDPADTFLISSVKSKLQQILLNLIKNAIGSLIECKNPDKKLMITIKKLDISFIQIIIQDNGVGIAEQNLDKIFSFGFKTKIQDYGYGLHSSFLLAKELGGTLSAQSDGVDKGATFILEVPI